MWDSFWSMSKRKDAFVLILIINHEIYQQINALISCPLHALYIETTFFLKAIIKICTRKHANESTFYKGNCFEQLPAKSKKHILDTHSSLPVRASCITDAPNHIRSFRRSACIYIAYLQNHAWRNAGKNLLTIFTIYTIPHFISTQRLVTTTTVRQGQSKVGEWQRIQTFSSTQSAEVTQALQQILWLNSKTMKSTQEKWKWMNHNGRTLLKPPKE